MVPFEQLGSGQSGRLVYQVLGENGPIFNPSGIRYLPPDSTSSTPADVAPVTTDIAAGLAGINLAVSAGTLVMSAAVLASVQRLHKKFDTLNATVKQIDKKLDALSGKVKKIDIRVSETHLREAIRHCLKKACSQDEISFVDLRSLHGDIETIIDAIEDPVTIPRQSRGL
jgi:hypothetical protein